MLRSAPSSSASLSRPVPSSTATRSPGASPLTPSPTLATTPTASRPGTSGMRHGPQSPRHCCTSPAVRHEACTTTSMLSLGSGPTSSYVKGCKHTPGSLMAIASMCKGTGGLLRFGFSLLLDLTAGRDGSDSAYGSSAASAISSRRWRLSFFTLAMDVGIELAPCR